MISKTFYSTSIECRLSVKIQSTKTMQRSVTQ